ncbi:hypothetical protein Droror1_Dr00018074 [Drosera rotundifolia]
MAAELPPPPPLSDSDPEQPQTTSEPESSHKDARSSGTAVDPDVKSPLELAEELIVKGSVAVKDGDFGEATDCFSRALEIRLLSTVCGKHVLKLVDLCSFLVSMAMMLTRGVLKRWCKSISGHDVEFFSIRFERDPVRVFQKLFSGWHTHLQKQTAYLHRFYRGPVFFAFRTK